MVPPNIPRQSQPLQYSSPSYAPGEVFAKVQPLDPPPKTSMSMADAVAALAQAPATQASTPPPAPTMRLSANPSASMLFGDNTPLPDRGMEQVAGGQGVLSAPAAMAMRNALLASRDMVRPTQNPESMLPEERRRYEEVYGAPSPTQRASGNPVSALSRVARRMFGDEEAQQQAAQGPSYAMAGPGGRIAGGIGRGDYGVAEAATDLVQQQQLAAAQGALPMSQEQLAEINRARRGQEAAMPGGGAMQGVSGAFRSGLISDQPGNWADRAMAAEQAMQTQANVQRGDRVMGEQLMRQRFGQGDGEGMYVRPLEGDERQGTGGFNFALTRRPDTDYTQNKQANDARVAANRAQQGGYSDRQLRRMKPAAMASALFNTGDPKARQKMIQSMTPRKAQQVLGLMKSERSALQGGGPQQGQAAAAPKLPIETLPSGAYTEDTKSRAETVLEDYATGEAGEQMRDYGWHAGASPVEVFNIAGNIIHSDVSAQDKVNYARDLAAIIRARDVISKDHENPWSTSDDSVSEWFQQTPGEDAEDWEYQKWLMGMISHTSLMEQRQMDARRRASETLDYIGR